MLSLGVAIPQWVVGDGISHLPLADRAYAAEAKRTALALWDGPIERHALVRTVRVMSVDSPPTVFTASEKALVRFVFGDAIDCSRVKLVRGKWWPFQPRRSAMAPMGNASQRSPGGLGMYTGAMAMATMRGFQRSQDALYTLAADTGGNTKTTLTAAPMTATTGTAATDAA